VRDMAGHGCLTNMHVVRLVAPHLDGESASKDIDFSRAGIQSRWQAGLEDTRRVLAAKPWAGDVDPLAGFHLHEQGKPLMAAAE
jgi:NTE family protein